MACAPDFTYAGNDALYVPLMELFHDVTLQATIGRFGRAVHPKLGKKTYLARMGLGE
jgi:hypothetical protein|tara:strand:+ start:462 stop:632 length:171 start_codon:yes stop_codon:yes gene_type:complete